MMSFAEQVWREIQDATPGAQRLLNGELYTLALIDGQRRWFAPDNVRTLTNVAMYDASISG